MWGSRASGSLRLEIIHLKEHWLKLCAHNYYFHPLRKKVIIIGIIQLLKMTPRARDMELRCNGVHEAMGIGALSLATPLEAP